jgi:hypothetical protein
VNVWTFSEASSQWSNANSLEVRTYVFFSLGWVAYVSLGRDGLAQGNYARVQFHSDFCLSKLSLWLSAKLLVMALSQVVCCGSQPSCLLWLSAKLLVAALSQMLASAM